jgi:hypothetical protein
MDLAASKPSVGPSPSLTACPACLQVIILVGALLAALFLVLLQLPVPGGAAVMPLLAVVWAAGLPLAVVWAAGLPLALLAQSVAELPPLPEAAERLLPDSDKELDDERRDAIRSAALPASAARACHCGDQAATGVLVSLPTGPSA